MFTISHSIFGAAGSNVGAGADGVLLGKLTATAASKAILKAMAGPLLCITDDGGLYVDETAALADATADDVEVLPATPAVDDAVYFGHATGKFDELQLNITTQGDGDWTIAWEYWDGSAWTALSGVTDGTTAFEATTGFKAVTFTIPSDWAQNTVDSVLGYWIRARVSAYTSVVTAPQLGQGYVKTTASFYTDDTTDFNDAGAGDVALLPTYGSEGDAFYIGYSAKFCKVKLTTSQARTGTLTMQLKYWNGSSWAAIPIQEDASVGYSATAGTHMISFVPPSDWVANTAANGPNGQAGFFVKHEVTAFTDLTQQPLATQGWVYPLVTGGDGVRAPKAAGTVRGNFQAETVSGTAEDSVFLVMNVTKGTCVPLTWTKAEQFDYASAALNVSIDDKIALAQITEDGTTEFADCSINLHFV
jgi:hypothetical protein